MLLSITTSSFNITSQVIFFTLHFGIRHGYDQNYDRQAGHHPVL